MGAGGRGQGNKNEWIRNGWCINWKRETVGSTKSINLVDQRDIRFAELIIRWRNDMLAQLITKSQSSYQLIELYWARYQLLPPWISSRNKHILSTTIDIKRRKKITFAKDVRDSNYWYQCTISVKLSDKFFSFSYFNYIQDGTNYRSIIFSIDQKRSLEYFLSKQRLVDSLAFFSMQITRTKEKH